MKIEFILDSIDHIGVLFFAISGMLTASERNLDVLVGYIIAFITALGGGTIRDLLLNIDIAWMGSVSHFTMVIIGGTIGLLFKKVLSRLRRTFFIFDTVGIALYTILRDVLCNKVPLIFRKELYAIPCLTGGTFYIFGLQLFAENKRTLLLISMDIIILFRTLAVIYEWKMPLIKSL